jgi:hypothetical protein
VFYILYNIFINLNKQDLKENLDRKESDENNKIKKQIKRNNKKEIKSYNITDKKKQKQKLKRIQLF